MPVAVSGVGTMLDVVSVAPGLSERRLRPEQRARLGEVLGFIDANYSERISLGDLALVAGLSVCRFVTIFRREMGISPHRYVCAVRVQAAQRLLLAGVPPAVAAIEVGFFDQSHLCRHFRSVCRMTPGQFLAAHAAGRAVPSEPLRLQN
jgi:AraC-like DNA-binding protein